ncbi:unnamed protein product [marine sediment metagenome]|uniref:Uncharacterized protein n=1 Tax=marine sediment metagenome TaxID=412755 RepID=X0S9A0_9ZZZZ
MTTSEIKEQDLTTEITTKANIIDAIDCKQALLFSYNKDVSANKPRKIYPHNFYWRGKKLMLDAFQVSGDSLTGNVQTFKQFDVSLIKDCIIIDESFEVQTGYNGKSDRYNNSICGVIN